MDNNSKKLTILFIDRPRLRPLFLETIESMKERFNIVVLAVQSAMPEYTCIPGIYVEQHINDKDVSSGQQILKHNPQVVQEIERELGINCYKCNINYLLYRKFASKYGVGESHRFENEHIPELLVMNYFRIKTIVEKYNVDYAFFETIDTLDTVILEAMAQKGLISQTLERGILSIGGKVRTRIASGKFKRSPKLNYVYSNKLFSTEAMDWAKDLVNKTKDKRQVSLYDLTHMKMGATIPKYSFSEIKNKVERVINNGESFIPAILKQKNRLLSAKYFANELPAGKLIAYFLQMTPEASMCYQTPRYATQEYLIEQAAINGKYGYSIVVKEHPRAFGNRPKSFYEELSFLPNVTLLPPSFSNRELLLNSEAVLSAGGTSPSLESLVSGTPVITVGHPYFDVCTNVHNIDRPEDLWDIIEDIEFDEQGRIDFLAALYEASYTHPEANTIYGFTKATGLGPILAQALEDEIDLYERKLLISEY
ncbi:hypothetical protein [Maridesulfovibrio sp. FT414]|uniref:capsular polysaccharide export protein, LipB/KpsS family n=1 Tax=Maridesulfovibrio sp. FT414 TaxID=2979469 RepID=UPI003D8012EB